MTFPKQLALSLLATSTPLWAEKTTAELTSLNASAPAGSTLEVALHVTPAQGLHVYHLDPGAMGYPVKLEWDSLPEGIKAGPLRFPVPHRVSTGELPTNGYEEPTYFFTRLTLSPNLPPGPQTLSATASWLACDDSSCIPGKQSVTLNFEVLPPGKEPSSADTRIASALSGIPVDAPSGWKSTLHSSGNNWLITLTPPTGWEAPDLSNFDLFSETSEFIEPGAKPSIEKSANQLKITAPKSEYADQSPTPTVVLAGPNPPLRFQLEINQEKSE